MSETINVPAVVSDAAVARIKSEIDISDRSRIVTFGDRAQRSVVEFADRILAQTQNKELGATGKLLSDILAKARGLDPATLKDSGFFSRLFSSMEARLRRFSEQFGDVASQIDRVCVELDRNKETLRRDIARPGRAARADQDIARRPRRAYRGRQGLCRGIPPRQTG